MTLARLTFLRRALVIAALPTLLAVLGVWVVQAQLKMRLMAAAETRLLAEMQGFGALYDQRRIVALREAIDFRSQRGDPAGSVYLLMDRDGAVLAGNLAQWPAGITPESGAPQRVTLGGAPYLATAQALRGGFPLLVGVSLLPMQDMLAQMLRIFALFGAVILFAGLTTAALVARRARARLARINASLSRIGGAGGMATRLDPEPENGAEYAELARHINAMLERIAHLFDAHQRLGNAVAHEMRTPLARIRARLDTLDLDTVARAGLEEEIRATIRLFDSLLSIAQMDAEAGNTKGLAPVDLSTIAAGIAELYTPVAEEQQRTLLSDLEPGAVILGDTDLLAQLMSNLIENGLKYTRPGDTIRLSVRRKNTRVKLRIEDDGPGVDEALKARLFTPFARGHDCQTKPGHGLGLSLVRAIALRHGAIPRILAVEKGFAIEIDCLHFSPDDVSQHTIGDS